MINDRFCKVVKGEDDVSIVMQFSDQMRVVESVYVGKIDE